MDSAVRKKRTLAERRESDKLRQRRFRAKKKEEARVLQIITGTVEKQKERVYSVPKKTADQIRETNRIRQQRFRARRRGEILGEELLPQIGTIQKPIAQIPFPPEILNLDATSEDPVNLVQRIILQAASDEKNRQTEIRREKDRIRKRRERQRKKDRGLKLVGYTPEDIMKQRFQEKIEDLQIDLNQVQSPEQGNSTARKDEEFEEDYDDVEEDNEVVMEDAYEENSESEASEYFDASQFMAQLEEMGLVLGMTTPSSGSDGSPVLEIRQKTSGETSEESTSSSPITPSIQDMYPFQEKKPWQRCNSAEERRERERMRKRMYRAKQKFISTGKLEMQWDPAPIKRTPNDESEEGITPLPDWNNSNMSVEQKLAAHRIYNRRYRERLKSSSVKEGSSRSESRETSVGETSTGPTDQSQVSPEAFTKMLSTIFSSQLVQNQTDE